MSKRNKKKNKKTPEQMAVIYENQRLAMERNKVKQEADELENGQKRKVVKFGKWLIGCNESHNPINPNYIQRKCGKGQATGPVNPKIQTYMKSFGEKSGMELIDVKGAFHLFVSEFGLVILSDNHKKLDVSKRFLSTTGIKYGNVASLEWIVANPEIRNSGWGNTMLDAMTSVADELDVDMVLHCSNGRDWPETQNKENDYHLWFGADTGSLDNDRLMSFYEKYDFQLNPFHVERYLRIKDDPSQLEEKTTAEELMMRPSNTGSTKEIKFPTLFSGKVQGENVKFSWKNTTKNFKKIAKAA